MKHEEAGDLERVLSARELAAYNVAIPEGVTVLTSDEIRRAVGQQAARQALEELSEVTDADD